MPQPPQLFGSVAMSRHVELKPSGQQLPMLPEVAWQKPPEKFMHVACWQKPLMQAVPAAHAGKQLLVTWGRHEAEKPPKPLRTHSFGSVEHCVPQALQFF